ncbi:MAG TPA: alanine racemase [Candidatus Limnocylindrales bacterium]
MDGRASPFAIPAGIETPALVVDLERLEANIERLQRELDRRGVGLRPHAKTHKSVRIARLQLEAGAHGITVGTLGEAEVFATAGFRDVFLAYPLWAEGPKASRLRDVHDAISLSVGIDSEAGAERLAAAVAGARRPLSVLVELDSGGHRTGVESAEAAAILARAASRLGLHVNGVFTHGGHSYAPGGAAPAAADEVATLEAGARALEAAGVEVRVISAGSTPTMTDAAAGRVNEIRAGTYVLGDRQQWALGAIPAVGVAAHVVSTVVSEGSDHAIVDAGAKTLTKDRAEWLDGYGLLPDYPAAIVARLYDYHGAIVAPDGAPPPARGELVSIVPNHICPVVDLFDAFWLARPDGTVERWPVDARGRNG